MTGPLKSLSSILKRLALMNEAIRYVQSAIEDLAFTNRSSRVTIWDIPILSALLY